MPEENKLRIIKTGYAYSKEWVINDNNYKTCNVGGGFLGILVDSNIKDVNVTLKFKPDGFDLGTLIALVSSGTYLGILLIAFTVIIIKKKSKSFLVLEAFGVLMIFFIIKKNID